MYHHRFLTRLFLLVGFTGTLLGSAPATIDDMAAWSVIGTDKKQLIQSEGTLNLVPNAQMYRTISGSRITVKLDSSPVFGDVATDLPVLELGDAAVTFLRNGATGRLLLVVGNNPAMQLPFEIALDTDGRSQQSLVLTLSRLGETVAVTVRGQTLPFPGISSVDTQEIVLSTGATQSWLIQGLTVVNEQPPATVDVGLSSNADNSAINRASQVRDQPIEAQAHFSSGADVGRSTSNRAVAVTKNTTPAKAVTLEIFTPPAVRHGRAHRVRQAAMAATQK